MNRTKPFGAQLRPVWFELLAVLVLCAPSLLLLLPRIPPLWRDVDAYNQVTVAPVKAMYLGHGPFYLFLARLPLWMGAQWEALTGRLTSAPSPGFFQPHLTDSGILLLLLLQHAGVIAATWLLITAISRRPCVRVLLALLWTTGIAFYTLAHCVGSETLSLIWTLLFAAAGLKIIQRQRASYSAWRWFGAALFAILLTRYVNLWLVLVLPLTFLFAAVLEQFRVWLTKPPTGRVAATLRRAALAGAIGVLCIFSADLVARTVCRANKLYFHSMLGHTFLWRLQFVGKLPKEQRDVLFERIQHPPRDAETARLLASLRDTFNRGEALSAAKIESETAERVSKQRHARGRVALDAALNSLAWSFLLPPAPELLREARFDFERAQQTSQSDIARSLFNTTGYYFDHAEQMPEAANLVTFRGTTRDAIVSLPSRFDYFQFARSFTYQRALLVWLGAFVALGCALRYMRRSKPELLCYAFSLTLVGLLMMASSCLFGELLPRYTLPMWEMLCVSFLILLGTGLELIGRKRRSLRTATGHSSETR